MRIPFALRSRVERIVSAMARRGATSWRDVRMVPVALGFALLAGLLAVGTAEPQVAGAYTAADLPPLPTYCHPNVDTVPWPDQVPGCSIGLVVSSSYPPLNEDGSYHVYGGPVFSRLTMPVTNYGSISSPPSFVVTADYGVWENDGLRRVKWDRLTWYPFLPGDNTALFADPVTTCGLKATTCTYRFDSASMAAAVSAGLGNTPKWSQARITIPVQHAVQDGDGDATYAYATTGVALGFYKTDNKSPVANFTATPIPGSAVRYHFDGAGSSDPDGETVARYVWDFGDGSLAAEGKAVDHTYASPGEYRVTLRVLDPQGAQGTAFRDLKRQLTISNVAISAVPKDVGDQFDLTVTVRNDAADTMPCVFLGGNIDIRPTSSFTKISGPANFEATSLARGATLTKTWRYQLKAPVPATFDIYPSATGGGSGGACPDAYEPTHVTKKVTYTIGGAQPWAPFGSWTALVARQYQDVLGRAPTSSESATWTGKLTAGTSTAGDLVTSLRRTTDNQTNVDATTRLYKALLGRTPDPSGLKFWIGRRRAGTWTLVKMADYFAASNEFTTKYGDLTNKAFVTRIYEDVLGRTADPSGVTYWTKQLDLKRRTRGSVIVGFSDSNEYKTKQAEATDASVAYILLLGRAPNGTELTAWVTGQKNGASHATLVQQLLASTAYAARVGGS